MDESNIHSLGENIWSIEGPWIRFYGFPYPTRMYIILLPNNLLWIHSPIALTGEITQFVHSLGKEVEVGYLVSPNTLHNLYIKEWAKAFPEAKVYGLPGVVSKLKGIKVNIIQDKGEEEGEREQLISGEKCPWCPYISHIILRGAKFMAEVVFFHEESKSVIITDFVQRHDTHLPQYKNCFWRTSMKLDGGMVFPRGGTPLELCCSVTKPRVLKDCLLRVLNWDFQALCISHGVNYRQGGKEALADVFKWCLEEKNLFHRALAVIIIILLLIILLLYIFI